MKKISHHMEQRHSLRPDISYPVLLTTTLNPNDADGHRSLSTFNPNSIQSHWDHLNKSTKLSTNSPVNKTNNPGANDKITFKDLKRYASNSFASLSSGITQNGWRSLNFIAPSSGTSAIGRSTFYEADTSQGMN